jgi:deoxyribose-phosphate aldolase
MVTRQLEIYLAVKEGANEIDSVINRAAALEQNWRLVYDEVRQMKRSSSPALLKMILSAAELGSFDNIYKASFASMLAGNFIILI